MTAPTPGLQATHPDFLTLFPAGATPQRRADGFTWTEGPVYMPDRRAVIFSDVRQNRTWRWNDDHTLTEEMNPSHHQNGHCLDAQGRLIACSHGQRALLRQDEPGGPWTVLADTYDGLKLSSPNDVALHPDGSLWFTDPTYGIDKPEEGYGGTREQPGNYVYRLDPDGTLSAPIRDRVKPNGLAFTSATQLLLADTGEGKVHAYTIHGTQATYDRLWFTVTPGKTDGLRIDEHGRIWSSAGDGVHVLTPDGQELGRILVGQVVSNLCFGGPDGTTLFITASTEIWTVPTLVRERHPSRP